VRRAGSCDGRLHVLRIEGWYVVCYLPTTLRVTGRGSHRKYGLWASGAWGIIVFDFIL
jgi:hypothetical protein